MRLTLLALLTLLTACNKAPTTAAAPTTEGEKTLYALGLSVGRSLAIFNLTPAELAQVQHGMSDVITNQKPAVELDVYGPKLNEFAKSRNQARTSQEKSKAAGFLESASKEKGAQKLPSGLVYVEQTAGNGESPNATDTVKVHYRGTLTDGTEFDSSYTRNEPAEFPLNAVIPCWTEGVQKMKPGGKAKLVCPAQIAYGDDGKPPKIAGGATLVFEIELLEVKKS
ncbi:MAG: FKBP-type peptidyl-prolyl cis-trans isomerase [Myxococcaceae bacterium]